MKRRAVCGLIWLGVPLFFGGCGKNAGSPGLTASEQQTLQQAIARVQNDARIPPQEKEKILRQMQSETARQQNAR